MWPAALPRWMTWRPAAGRRLCLLPLDTLSVFHPWSFPEAVYQSAPQACSQCYVQKKNNGWISDVVSDKHKDDNTCHFVCLTFWRSLCTPARLWPAATRRSCPESEAIRLCGCLAVEESREVKKKVVVTQQGGRPCRRTYRRIGRDSVAPRCLQDSLWNVAFIAELVANKPPLFGLLDHLQSAKTKRCNLSNLEEKMAHLARCLHPPTKKIPVLACFCWTSNIWKETTRRSHWLEPTPGEGVDNEPGKRWVCVTSQRTNSKCECFNTHFLKGTAGQRSFLDVRNLQSQF